MDFYIVGTRMPHLNNVIFQREKNCVCCIIVDKDVRLAFLSAKQKTLLDLETGKSPTMNLVS